jgi:uncharacterized membrane protein
MKRAMNPVTSFLARPTLLAAIVAGGATALLLAFVHTPIPLSGRPLAAWDVFALVYLITTNWALRDDAPGDMARRAEATDDAKHFFLILCVLAAALSVWAVALECHEAKTAPDALKGVHIAFAMGTVALSWLFTHVVFAVHYAHEYYGADDKKGPRGGLKFPGNDKSPNWWDFFHFALVVGVAAQTADVQIESREIRRTVTWHGIVAFVFNTMIVALTVNLAAGLL